MDPAKYFLPTNSRRKALIEVLPDPFGKVFCERDSFVFAVLSH